MDGYLSQLQNLYVPMQQMLEAVRERSPEEVFRIHREQIRPVVDDLSAKITFGGVDISPNTSQLLELCESFRNCCAAAFLPEQYDKALSQAEQTFKGFENLIRITPP